VPPISAAPINVIRVGQISQPSAMLSGSCHMRAIVWSAAPKALALAITQGNTNSPAKARRNDLASIGTGKAVAIRAESPAKIVPNAHGVATGPLALAL
jgi:hypothetical protein